MARKTKSRARSGAGKRPLGKPGRKPAGRKGVARPPVDGSPPQTPGFPVVGIGASAGGIEAFTQVLASLPVSTRMAFVLIQHLAPLHKSMLTEILSNATRMPVHEVMDGMPVKSGHVYVIPPNTSLGIFHGVLHLVPRTESRGKHLPIDYFMKSLADDQKSRAIGVILAGTASDGAMGLKAIKAEGGITIAQEPATAKYDGMPRAAIAAGVVDFVLPPDRIASELTKIASHPYFGHEAASRAPNLPEAEGQLHKVFFLLKGLSGVDFSCYKHATVRRRIQRRMVLHRIERLPDYVKYLKEHAEEVEALYQDILIHVTSFFRDPEAFEVLKKVVFPSVVKHRERNAPLRFWVPGCSTGEEAYSLAMAILEFAGSTASSVPVQIFASDISHVAVEKARSGFYPQSIEADVAPERLRRFFSRSDGGYRISKTIRDLCVFAKQDMTRDPPFSKLDLITCRNVLIYLGSTLQKRALTIFHYALKPTGYLMLGNSETIGSFTDFFALADKKHKLYKKKTTLARLNLEFPTNVTPEKADIGRPPHPSRARGDLTSEVDRIILDRFAPAGVVVNGDLQIVQFRGQTGNYLEPAAGVATLNVLKMARSGLMIDLRDALLEARKGDSTVRREKVSVKQGHGPGEVNIEVIPLSMEEGEKHYLVLFWDHASDRRRERKKGVVELPKKREKESVRIGQLEDELMATREYLQSIIQDQEATNEELQSANEEILSSNEELQSTNEELETAKEELQSANEELNTVNDELQTRNQELSLANSDLTNLFANIQIPIVMVGNDLRIRRVTPLAERIFNLIPGDVGRPIGDIKHTLEFDGLEASILDAIDSVTMKEIEVRDEGGRWYSLRIRPYRNVENRIDGAVLALVDIHSLKQASEKLGEQIARWGEVVKDPFMVLGRDLRVRSANKSFCERFGVSPGEAEDTPIDELAMGRWDGAAMRELLDTVSKDGKVKGFVVARDGSGSTPLRASALLLHGVGQESVILLSLETDGPPPSRVSLTG